MPLRNDWNWIKSAFTVVQILACYKTALDEKKPTRYTCDRLRKTTKRRDSLLLNCAQKIFQPLSKLVNVVLTCETVEEILTCHLSNESETSQFVCYYAQSACLPVPHRVFQGCTATSSQHALAPEENLSLVCGNSAEL